MVTIPDNAKFVYFTQSTVHHEGDERSRTNPGHGYPEYTEYFLTPVFVKTEEELKLKLKFEKTMPKVFRLTPVKVTSEIVISMEE